MRLKYALYWIALVNAGCSTKVPSHSNESEHSSSTAQVVEQKRPLLACVEQMDAGIEMIEATEQWAKENGFVGLDRMDPGFAKWYILFHDIPDNPPYSFGQKRLLQALPDHYYPLKHPSPKTILESKESNTPVSFMLSVRGYLPGEKITIRLSSKDAYREVTFYPRPLHVKRNTGEVLARATLLCATLGETLYLFDVCGVGEQEKYTLTSNSGGEILSHDWQGPLTCTIMPEVIGQMQGFAKIQMRFGAGEEHAVALPWGYELIQCRLGNK